jgi:acyl-CoA thioesterase I
MEPMRFAKGLSAGESLRLFGLGDSLTYGYMVGSGYFDQLVDALKVAYPKGRLAVKNHGVCGATAKDGARRFSMEIAGDPPDLLLIQFGLNDLYMGVRAGTFRDTVRRIIDGYVSVRAEGEIVLVPPPPLDNAAEQALAAPFTEALKELAEAPDVRVADVAGAWTREAKTPLFLLDGVHPSEAGYSCMKDAVCRVVSGA